MNIFFSVCWGASYLMLFCSFVIWGWRWSEEIATAQATFFWLLMTAIFAGIGIGVVLSFRNNPPTLP